MLLSRIFNRVLIQRSLLPKSRISIPSISTPPFQRIRLVSTMAAQEYKLKGLASLTITPGSKQEIEVEGIEGGKVLVVATATGKVSAIGAKCTHYGAPLVKGVLTGAGRLTCPWHGACFNATNGDVEDAPGLDALPHFPIAERDGAVYITGTESAIKSSRRAENSPCKVTATQEDAGVVIVGGGSGALGAVDGLREQGYSGNITIISNEGYLPIDRPKLSKALITDADKIAWRQKSWYDAGAVTWVDGEVTGVDFANHSVTTKSGDSISYSKVILATGGTPRLLPMQGFRVLSNIFTLRTITDTKKIVDAIGSEKGKNIVIVGSSFIGMEIANAVAADNKVSVIGMEKVPLERVLGEQIGSAIQTALSAKGITFYMNAGVEKADPSTNDASAVGSVTLQDGTKLDADLVILGVGVAPATEYLKENKSISLEKDGSIKTNEYFVIDGQEDAYAVGDIATYPYYGPGGDSGAKHTRIEHWNVAQNAGRAAASHIVDSSQAPKNFIPVFWSALGSQLRYCGNSSPSVGGWDDLVVHGDLSASKFIAFYTRGDIVVAAASMGMDPYVMQTAELMRTGNMASKSMLEAGYDVLSMSA